MVWIEQITTLLLHSQFAFLMKDIARKWVGAWLLMGCAMVFFQVIVGGVTRLTESGLSITEWKPFKGVVPPLSEEDWQKEFELYKNITQFKTLNQDITLNEFKWIYFWEYFHRFWARFMGLAFIFPFVFFIAKGWLNKDFYKKIGVLFLWGGLIGVYGWIMVKSGLTGMYVPPFHLSIHLLLAMSLFAYLVWITIYVLNGATLKNTEFPKLKNPLLLLSFLLVLQVFMGGVVSGMKAGLAYPTWPDMNGEIVPAALFNQSPNTEAFLQYNANDYWGRTFIQFMHRTTAYLIALVGFWFYVKRKDFFINNSSLVIHLLPLSILLQVAVGIITVLNCRGHIPVLWGVLHQAGAMLLIANVAALWFFARFKVVQNKT